MKYLLLIIVIVNLIEINSTYLESTCICDFNTIIDDCNNCKTGTIDNFNNYKVYPRLNSLLNKNYFRFIKINFKKPCPFWFDDNRCSIKYCHILPCEEQEIPLGIKEQQNNNNNSADNSDNENCGELSYLNKTLSDQTLENLQLWTEYENFCVIDDNDPEAEFVDLLLNPERYTGYKGQSAQRIWKSIYLENCFRPKINNNYYNNYIKNDNLNAMCLEERVYYRVISGLHASINIHLSSNYLLKNNLAINKGGEWGPNLDEFLRRFSPEMTENEGPNWLKNLYFIYLIELRAIEKAKHFLKNEQFYTGNDNDDYDTKLAINDLLKIIETSPKYFNENDLFKDNDKQQLKRQFKEHFRNVTRIMDCVGCDKCKLWGKIQTRGLGTALKILFSNNSDELKLQRGEIVALFNAFGRLSNSIYKLDDFREMLKAKNKQKWMKIDQDQPRIL